MNRGPSDRLNGVLCGLAAALIWGAFPVATRFGIEHTSLDGYDITFIRFGVSGIILFPFLLASGLKGLGWKQVTLMVVGIGAPYMLIVSLGLTDAPVERFAVITPGSMIIFSVVLGAYFLNNKLTPREMVGVMTIVCGIFLIGYNSFGRPLPGSLYSFALFVLGGLMWATYTIATRRYNVGSMHATIVVSVYSMILYTPFYFLVKGDSFLQHSPRDLIFQAVYQGVLVSIFALFFYSKAVFLLGSTVGSTFAALVPGAAVVLAAIFLGEQLSALSIAGLSTVTLGMVLCLARGRRPSSGKAEASEPCRPEAA